MEGASGAYLGLLSLLSFAFSVMVAVLAIDMYTLLRTGEFGKTWRVLIIASVMFALTQALRMAEILGFPGLKFYHLSEVVELMFVVSLAYAFYLQRRVFSHEKKVKLRQGYESSYDSTETDDAEAQNEESRDQEWPHLTGHYIDVAGEERL